MSETRSYSNNPLLQQPNVNAYGQAIAEQQALQDEWSKARLELRVKCEVDMTTRAAVMVLCAEDPVFFFQNFLWTYDPRAMEGRQTVPFIPYKYQEELIWWLENAITSTQGTAERENLLIEKSRDMGASWTVFAFMFWRWLFKGSSFLIISRKEEEVDKKGDMDTPFQKIRFMMDKLPPWMVPQGWNPREHDKHLLLINPKGGEIAGESSNKHTGRGGRKTMVVFDEQQAMGNDEAAYMATAQTTNVRLSIGTPNGPIGLYYRMANGKEKDLDGRIIRVNKKRLHWTIHPVKAAGLTVDEKGRPTSHWYESQCKTMSQEHVAAELDISYATSVKGLIYHEYKELHRWRPKNIAFTTSRNFGDDHCRIIRVWDPGLTFANLWIQKDRYGRCLVLKELILENTNINEQAEMVQEISAQLARTYKLNDSEFDDCGDPAGGSRTNSGQEVAEYDILRTKYDIDVDYLFISETATRLRIKNGIAAIKQLLSSLCYQTETPRLLVDVEQCPKLDEALSQNYRWKVDRYTKQVFEGRVDEAHPYEDVADCLRYGVLWKWGFAVKDKQIQQEIAGDEIVWS